MRHLIVSREFPPASYSAGGIGAYVDNIARLLAEAGDTVHVIAERWRGAPLEREERCEGRLVIHRVPLDAAPAVDTHPMLGAETFPAQRFAWRAALLAESLVSGERVDVIEGQDWEAPLYYLLGRRALGLGPDLRPPCLLHLHTPTEFVFRWNEWSLQRPEQRAITRMEEFCIQAADALVSPSQYMAVKVGARYGVPPRDVLVIPYPLGNVDELQRSTAVWQSGSFAYAGRLEVRKGVIEFIDAAIRVCALDSSLRFEFAGEDSWHHGRATVRRYMEARIPRRLRGQFAFHGQLPRTQLTAFLAGARVAVVPSRGENYPYACIEAMASGLPVLASPNGGMVEMIDDGVAGWIAPSQTRWGLVEALERARTTPPERLQEIGRAAARAIRQRCGNDVIVRQHRWIRHSLATLGPYRSVGRGPANPVPDFAPIRFASVPTLGQVARLPLRDKATVMLAALREPRRALAWLRSALWGP